MPSRAQLERAAAAVISILKSVSEYSDNRVAVIGGLALWKYISNGRTTEDVDFIINIDTAPQSVKQKLLNLPNSPFVQQAQIFYYKAPDGSHIQIDITPGWQSPYIPAAAQKLRNLPAGVIPYISPIDLIVFKVNSCGMRAQRAKKIIDAADAQALLDREASRSPLRLDTRQKQIVEPCIKDMVTYGTKTEEWWRQRLGLAVSQEPAGEYWTWSEQYGNYYHRNEDGSYEWAAQGGSSTS